MKILTKALTVRLPEHVHQELLELSKNTQCHPTVLVREAIIASLRTDRLRGMEVNPL